ncbi:hypothetical protein V7S43_016644 [Phytophthora oleae]|uniref:Enoyl reductase (ER) domain-containing protein n=1 Tax=Phytophthora oleae TaxID=2107226 RepID=A0ABD3EYL6_9STRA
MDSGWSQTMYPCVVGNEIVCEVTLAGEQVKDMKVGDRVGVGVQVWACLNKFPYEPCKECAKGTDAYCRHRVIPDTIPSDVAAPLLCAGTTVFTPLKEVSIKPGDRVGIVGIGVPSQLGIQFAKAMGAAAVVAYSRSTNTEQEIRRLGADAFVVYTDDKADAANLVDILLITADANDMPYTLCLSFLVVHGTMVMVDLPNDEIKFKPYPLVGKGTNFKGNVIGSIQDKDMLEVASKKNVRP